MASSQDHINHCSIHHGNIIDYYCQGHDKVGCDKCITAYHSKCNSVSQIETLTHNIEESVHHKHFQDNLNDIRFITKEINDNITEHETVLENGLSKEKAEVERLRSDMNMIFDSIMSNIEDREREALSKDMETTEALSHEAQTALLDLERVENQVENMRRSNKMKELFIKLKSVKPELNVIEKRMDQLCMVSNLGHNTGRLVLPATQGEAEVQLIKLEEACVEFKLSVSKTNPY